MPYHLNGKCVVKGTKDSPGKTVKCHSTRAKAKKHLDALMINVADALHKSLDGAVLGGPSVRDVLSSRIHRSFTVAADVLYGLGYMDREERIRLSGAIGDSLGSLDDVLDALHMNERGVSTPVARALAGLFGMKDGSHISTLLPMKSIDDADRWLAVSTVETVDRQGEVFTTKSMDWDIQRAKDTGDYPELRLWHVRGFKLGMCDKMERIGIYAVDQGYWYDTPFAQAMKDIVSSNNGKWKVSRAFYPVRAVGSCPCGASLSVGLENYMLGVMCPTCRTYYSTPNMLKDVRILKSWTYDITVTDSPVVRETAVAAYSISS